MYQKFSSILMGAATAIVMTGSAAFAEDWRAWNIHNDGHPNTPAMDRFAELVNTATNGEITIDVFHGGVLGSQPDALEQVRIGAIEVGNFSLGPIGPMVKEANLVSLPFIFKSVPHMFRVMEGEAGQVVADAMGEAGVLPLAWFDAGARSFGAENNFPSFKNVGHYEVTTHYSLSEHLIIPECICVNTAKFNALSEDMQAAVRGAAVEAALYQRELWAEGSQQARADVEAAGIMVNEIADKAPFQAAMDAVYDEYLAANPDMATLIDLAKSTE